MTKTTLLLVCFVCFCMFKIQGQTDSLKTKSFEYLFSKYDSTIENNSQSLYASAIINKAKIENDTMRLTAGYSFKSLIYKDEIHLTYLDSIINLTKDNSNKNQPAIAYLSKGLFYFNKRAFNKALENIFEARKFSMIHANKNLELECNQYIATLKTRLGNSEEALLIFKENLRHYQQTNSRNKRLNILKLNTIYSIAIAYNDLRQFDSTSYYNKLGTIKAFEFNNSRYENFFRFNQGINLYKKGNYNEALDSLNRSIPTLKETDDKASLAMAYFYTAKVYDKQVNSKETIAYFQKVDSIFRINNDIHPNLRETYEKLIRYYENIGDYKNQLEYISQLIRLDSILHRNEIFLNNEIIKEYDIPNLISEKERIIAVLGKKDSNKIKYFYWLFILILALLFGFYYQFKKRRIYKRRFYKIINKSGNDNKKSEFTVTDSTPKAINISDHIVEKILASLETFEKQKEYLNQETSLQTLAIKINTNAKYLSKIVNHYKKESFTHYINNLRITYAIEELKNNEVFRKYTLHAIANDVGFKKAESFSNAFTRKTGIKPLFFIKELNKSKTLK